MLANSHNPLYNQGMERRKSRKEKLEINYPTNTKGRKDKMSNSIAEYLKSEVKSARNRLNQEVSERKNIIANLPTKLLKYGNADRVSVRWSDYTWSDSHKISMEFHFSNDEKYEGIQSPKTASEKVNSFLKWINKNFFVAFDDKLHFEGGSQERFYRNGVISLGNDMDADIVIHGFSKPSDCKLVKKSRTYKSEWIEASCDK